MRAHDYLKKLLEKFVADNGYEWPEKANIETPKDQKFGDLATNLAMMLTRQAKKAPRDIAAAIAESISGDAPAISKVEIAGPGFLNVTFTPEFWQETISEVAEAGDSFGTSTLGAGKKIQVEYVSANPTGPLHIGHGRGAAVGDSLARILRAAGFDARTEYYLNDAGRQMRILGNSVWVRLQRLLGTEVPDPEDFYKGDYIIDIAQQVLDENAGIAELPENEILDICRETAMNTILDGIKADLADFHVEHQVWFSEKSLVETGAVEKTFKRLEEKGLAFEKDGAFWFKSTEFGDDKDRVLRKSDGSLTYFASDIAYHDNKFDRGFDKVVDIWGADHHGYVPRMKAAVEALGRDRDDLEVILVQLVNLLRGGEQIAMSTRAGQFETLADVVKETGSDAARYMFLSRKSDSHLDFDLELVKQKTMDNPVYYVQYAHARIHSVMRKAQEREIVLGTLSTEQRALLNTNEDLRVLKLLAQYPDIVESAAKGLSPHFISYYMQELAGALHRYYHANTILGAESAELVQARLHLLMAVAQVIRNGLGLLGVSAPERM